MRKILITILIVCQVPYCLSAAPKKKKKELPRPWTVIININQNNKDQYKSMLQNHQMTENQKAIKEYKKKQKKEKVKVFFRGFAIGAAITALATVCIIFIPKRR